MSITKKFGARLRSLRMEASLSQERLAELAGVHRTYVGMVERGEKNITLVSIEKFAIALKIKISYLLNGL
jgi:transcriptional regulator with XRE-family HTH domain